MQSFHRWLTPTGHESLLRPSGCRRHCHFTTVTGEDLRHRIATARAAGWASTENAFVSDDTGLAAPLFDAQGQVQGARAAASSPHLTASSRAAIPRELLATVRQVMALWGGLIPAELSALWRDTGTKV